MKISRTLSGSSPNGNQNELTLCLLGCEPNPPYGPNHHTAQLLLDLLCMAAEAATADATGASSAASTSKISWKGTISIDIYDVQAEQYPTDWEMYDGFLLPGSFASAYDNHPWITRLKNVIQTELVLHQRPTLAICFGHQILAHSFGEEGGGLASPVPTGAFCGRDLATCSPAGRRLWDQDQWDWYYTHGDQVEKIPSSAVCLCGNTRVPILSAAYFRSVEDAQQFHQAGVAGSGNDCPKPFAISFQAHPEYSTSLSLGLEKTLLRTMQAMKDHGKVNEDRLAQATVDVKNEFENVQRASVQATVKVCQLLGWFP